MKTGDTGQTYSKKVLEFLKEKHWFSLVFLVFLSAAAYLQTTGYGFAWDDHRLVKGGISTTEDLGDWLEFTGQIFQRWSQMTFRPVPMVLFSLDYLFWGNSPAGYHGVNVFLHALNTILVYLFFRIWAGSGSGGLWAGSLFAVHPVHVEAVAWVSGRFDLLVCLFVLTGLILACRSFQENRWGMRWFFAGGAVLFLGAALLTKEVSIIFPVLVWLVWYSAGRWEVKRLLPVFSLATFLVFFFLLLRFSFYLGGGGGQDGAGGMASFVGGGRGWGPTLLSAVFVTGEYLRLLLWPFSLKPLFIMPNLFWLDPLVFRSAVIIGLWGWVVLWAARRSSKAAVGLAWPLIGIVPGFSLFVFESVSPMAERLLYLPSVGLCLAFGVIVEGFLGRLSARGWSVMQASLLPAGLLMVLCAATVYQNPVWKDDLSLWGHAVKKEPASSLAFYNLGTAHLGAGDGSAAAAAFQEALRHQTPYPEAYYNLANALVMENRREEAVKNYRSAVSQRPDYGEAWVNLGITYVELGREGEAMEALKTAVRVSPKDAVAHNSLGNMYFLQKNWKEAVDHYQQALSLDPGYSEARVNLQRVLGFDRGGRNR